MNLSEKIKIIRKARRYSQEELGDKVGVSRQTVSDWEKGKFEPTLESIRCLVEVLNVSFDTLLNEKIDLNDEKQLNVALKNLSNDTKGKINNSFRYRIKEYAVTKKDYACVIIYFALLAISIAAIIVSAIAVSSWPYAGITFWIFIVVLVLLLSIIPLPIRWIAKIRNGGTFSSFGTLSQTHFVIIGWSDDKFDRTTYVPVTEIESMELDKDAKKKHGKVIVHIKGRKKPIVTSEIEEPQKLIDVFNNLETITETSDEQ